MLNLLTSATFFSLASAHAIFNGIHINNGPNQPQCMRRVTSNSPITDVSSIDIRCNRGGTRGVSGLCNVKPQDSVTVEMHQQPTDYTCKNEAIGGRHFGPVMIYMCEVSNAKSSTGDCSWVKIAQDSYNRAQGEKSWGTEMLNRNCGKKTFRIPSGLKPGQYLLRAEAIALHTAGQLNGAQFYMTCYQLSVSGGGSKRLPSGVRFPGAYHATDPGIRINIWTNLTSYRAPGPAVWKG